MDARCARGGRTPGLRGRRYGGASFPRQPPSGPRAAGGDRAAGRGGRRPGGWDRPRPRSGGRTALCAADPAGRAGASPCARGSRRAAVGPGRQSRAGGAALSALRRLRRMRAAALGPSRLPRLEGGAPGPDPGARTDRDRVRPRLRRPPGHAAAFRPPRAAGRPGPGGARLQGPPRLEPGRDRDLSDQRPAADRGDSRPQAVGGAAVRTSEIGADAPHHPDRHRNRRR